MVSLRWDSGVLRSLGQVLTSVLIAGLFSILPTVPADVAEASGPCDGQAASGLTISVVQDGDDCVVAFKAGSGTWTVPANVFALDYLVVGGGGGGGARGGGGAGSLIEGSNLSVVPGVGLSVSVGAGGALSSGSQAGSNGAPSFIGTVRADGGGGGSTTDQYNSGDPSTRTVQEASFSSGQGGSGGGGMAAPQGNWRLCPANVTEVSSLGAFGGTGQLAGTADNGLKSDGGDSRSICYRFANGTQRSFWVGAGGGGAGEPGFDATWANQGETLPSVKFTNGSVGSFAGPGFIPGAGGDGTSSKIVVPHQSLAESLGVGHRIAGEVYFAGGGGGGANYDSGGLTTANFDELKGRALTAFGGLGGGGSSGAGMANTGGGGGGWRDGNGGSGVVVVRYSLPSEVDQAASFMSPSGSDFDYIGTSSSVIPSLSFTAEAWIKPNLANLPSNGASIFSQGNGANTSDDRVFLWVNNAGDLIAGLGDLYYGTDDLNASVPDGAWTHLALTKDSSNVPRLYVNGSLVWEGAGNPGTYANDFWIGDWAHDSNRDFDGEIDQVKIWSTDLDESDLVKSMHTYSTSGVSVAANLVAHYDMNEADGPLELDRSGNGNHLTRNAVAAGAFTSSSIVETGSASPQDVYIKFNRSYLTAIGGWVSETSIQDASTLIVGGGGGGAYGVSWVHGGGGGGGGGVVSTTSTITAASVYSIQVGTGGLPQKPGLDSKFGALTAVGGGAGGNYFNSPTSGGSGGGAGNSNNGTFRSGGAETFGQGNAGGNTTNTGYNEARAGGGGGASTAGSSGAAGGTGGNGFGSDITGDNLSYGGGGGGGGGQAATSSRAAGGSGGGGAGGYYDHDADPNPPITVNGIQTVDGLPGTDGLGGGGGGGAGWVITGSSPTIQGSGKGGRGGSGAVILAYSLAPDAPTSLTATQSTSHATINLSWTAPSYSGNSAITDYDIEYKPAGGSWTSYSDGVSAATTRAVQLPQQCVAHEFRVIAKNSSFQSAASATASATPVWGTFGSLSGVQITSTNSECVVQFSSTDATTWTPPSGTDTVEALVLGGGGGGGAWVGGGGGGGGATQSLVSLTANSPVSVDVGDGGDGGSKLGGGSVTPAQNGEQSAFGSLIALGGGGGMSWEAAELSGSYATSGGASGATGKTQALTPTVTGQGFRGGDTFNAPNMTSQPHATGGGGGAGGPGQDAQAADASGDGGAGFPSEITGTTVRYGGGGGGGIHGTGANGADGSVGVGIDGGGNGDGPVRSSWTGDQADITASGQAGTDGLGGGGGGAGAGSDKDSIGGQGGSGLVVIRQLSSQVPSINTQPASSSAEPGQTKTLTVVASGNGTLRYQWQASTDGTNWSNVGTDSPSYTTPTLSLSGDGTRYRVVVSNTLNGETSVVTSSEAVISVVGVTIGSGLCETMVSSDLGATVSQTVAGGCLLEFTAPGSNKWFVPNNVSSVEALVVGGGGGGASGRGDGYDWYGGGAGGGGGEYTKATLDVTTSQQIPLVVGAGGAAGGASARGALPNPGGQGGNSSFSVSGAAAMGGSGGQGSTVLGVGGSGGAGGSGTGVAGSSGGDGSDGLAWRSYERPTDGGAAKLTSLGGEQYCLGGGGGGGNRGAGATHFYYQAQGGDCTPAGLGSGGDGNYFNGSNYVLAGEGTANTGGGGGGGSYNSGGGFAGAAGGSGLVALYYVPGAGAVSLSQPNAMSYSSTANTTSITLTKTSPGNASWTTSNQAICTVSGDNTGATVTVLIAGVCAVSVTVASAGGFSTGSAEVSFRIDKITQTAPGWDSATATVAFGGTLDLYEKLASPSGIANYSFTATGTGCAVTGVMLTVGDAGSNCSVTPTVNSTDKYLPATGTSLTVSVTKISQSALVLTSATSMNVDQTLTLSAAGGSGTGALSYHVADQGVTNCSVNQSTGALTATAAGSCEVYAKRALSTNYDEVTSSNVVITINKISQNLSWVSQPQAQYVAGNTYALEATASSQLTIAYSISAGLCTLAGTTVTFTGSGDCVIHAGQSGDASYLEAVTISQTVSVGKINQTMTFSALADKSWGSLAFSLSATASSALAITYTENNQTTNDACDVSTNGIVTIKNVGTCAITATQAGNSAYTSVTTTRLFNVTANQAGAPFIGSVSFGDRQLNASFFTPSFLGGGTVSAYELRAYELDGTLASTNTGCISQPGLNQSCSVIGLTNGVTYVLKVAAITQAGLGQLSASSSEVTPASNPEAVGNLAAFEGNAQLTITWTPPTSLGGGTFDQYRIFWRAPGGNYQANGSPGGTVGNQASTSFVITGLTNGVAYDVKVTTVTSVNTLELQSNTAEVRQTPFTVPDAPAAVVALDNDNNVVVAWQPPVFDGGNPIDQYVVEKDGNAVCTITSATTTSCEVTKPSPGTTSVIEVRAGNDAGLSVAASTSITVQSVQGASLPGIGSGSVSLPGISPSTPAPIVLDVSGSSVVNTNELVRLSGTNFNLVDRVLIGNIEASFFVNSAQLITIRIPIDVAAGKPTITLQGAFGSRIFTDLIEISVTQVSVDTKVTIGTFLGYAAVYTKNHEGKRLSMKIGNKWRVIDPLAANYTYNYTKVGVGRTVTVEVYIDRVLVQVKQIKIQ